MQDTVLRLAILLLVGLATYGAIKAARLFIARQRRRALAADPTAAFAALSAVDNAVRVRILAFSSEDCRPCHTLQAPALRRVQEAYGNKLAVTEIDAPTSPELAQHYHVLTVPTTVLLDAAGKAHAINYGFTNAQSLSRQVEEILALDGAQEALL